jgi:hypothetical protein
MGRSWRATISESRLSTAIEAYRAKFGDHKAAEFAADLYQVSRTPRPRKVRSSECPRWPLAWSRLVGFAGGCRQNCRAFCLQR